MKTRRNHEKPLVLCVDDEPQILAALKRELHREPYDIVTVEEPQEALAWLERCDVSVLVTDQRMPELRGSDLARVARRLSPRTACVLLTAYAPTGPVHDAVGQGWIHRLLFKPWEGDELKDVVRELVAGRIRPRPRARPARELRDQFVRVDCRFRGVHEVLRDLAPVFRRADPAGGGVVIDLEAAGMLKDPLGDLLQALGRAAMMTGIRAYVLDASGAASPHLGRLWGAVWLVCPPSRFPVYPRRRCLVVEDAEGTADFLVSLVRAEGHACDRAVGAVDAVRLFGRNEYDQVLLDLDVREDDSMLVVWHLMGHGRPPALVPISGGFEDWSPDAFENVRVRRRIAKPIAARDVLEAVRYG